RGRSGAARPLGRHAAEAAGLRRRRQRRRPVGPHHRRPHRPQPSARAFHRRRDRHDGGAMSATERTTMGLAETQTLEQRYLMRTYKRGPGDFVRGEGCLLWDADGKEYLDFLAGISVCSIGHCHPAVVAAVTEQAERLMHVSNLFYTEPMTKLAQRLSESSLGGRVFFCNSGTEAN